LEPLLDWHAKATEVSETKRIVVGRIKVTENGVEIDSSTVLCLTRTEEELIGDSLEALGYQKLDRKQLIKELAKHSDKPLFLARSE
jgi:hypothetical protein